MGDGGGVEGTEGSLIKWEGGGDKFLFLSWVSTLLFGLPSLSWFTVNYKIIKIYHLSIKKFFALLCSTKYF